MQKIIRWVFIEGPLLLFTGFVKTITWTVILLIRLFIGIILILMGVIGFFVLMFGGSSYTAAYLTKMAEALNRARI